MDVLLNLRRNKMKRRFSDSLLILQAIVAALLVTASVVVGALGFIYVIRYALGVLQ